MNRLQKIIPAADIIVFVCTTLAIAGVFYEGMTLKWYGFVGILVVCMDYTFMPATILHLIADKKDRHILPHIISLVMIVTAVIMKLAGAEYPAVTLVLWYFYIWFLYGSLIVRRKCGRDRGHTESKT